MAGYLVQDAVSGEPIENGSLSWQVVGGSRRAHQRNLAQKPAASSTLGAAVASESSFSAPGYAPTADRVVADGRRHTVLLQPQGAITIELEPAIEARMWLAREDQIDVLTLFTNVASKHEISEDGVIDVHDLDLDASYVGVVVAQGMAPAVTSFRDFSEPVSLDPRRWSRGQRPRVGRRGRTCSWSEDRCPWRDRRARQLPLQPAWRQLSGRPSSRLADSFRALFGSAPAPRVARVPRSQ